jgi:hypothetical protein
MSFPLASVCLELEFIPVHSSVCVRVCACVRVCVCNIVWFLIVILAVLLCASLFFFVADRLTLFIIRALLTSPSISLSQSSQSCRCLLFCCAVLLLGLPAGDHFPTGSWRRFYVTALLATGCTI